MNPDIVTMYNHNGPVLVDKWNVEARIKTGWSLFPIVNQEAETVKIEPQPEPAPVEFKPKGKRKGRE